ncbi:hypothetical protein CYMTET_35655 [Cymbomonas tetramitiformis]|uniref:Uncharacterized protein n=1 Tax=Cymbomonas tetramitiformis TaxID=36881 RepID=A0AAE0KNP8_9CHLO|nr:hypothetical protein CYMTET_35655 [Cymbomonas tetramitiformis]|eukprot:gene58-82_t
MLALLRKALSHSNGQEREASTRLVVKRLLDLSCEAYSESEGSGGEDEADECATVLGECDNTLSRLCRTMCIKGGSDLADAYDPMPLQNELLRVVLLQCSLRYWLMHHTTQIEASLVILARSSATDLLCSIERDCFRAIAEAHRHKCAPHKNASDAVEYVCTQLAPRNTDASKGCFVAIATLLLCRLPLGDGNRELADRLLRVVATERALDVTKQLIAERAIDAPAFPTEDAEHAVWRRRLLRWTVSKLRSPITDQLYQLCTEFLLQSRHVPASWGMTVPGDQLSRNSTAFKRNPASNVMARQAPERADELRERVRRQILRFGDAHRHDLRDETLQFCQELWELGVVALHYACTQECALNWMARYYMDDDLNPMQALFRIERFRAASTLNQALAVVRSRGRWFVKRSDHDRLFTLESVAPREDVDAWTAMAVWCCDVHERLMGIPCRGKSIAAVLRDIVAA